MDWIRTSDKTSCINKSYIKFIEVENLCVYAHIVGVGYKLMIFEFKNLEQLTEYFDLIFKDDNVT